LRAWGHLRSAARELTAWRSLPAWTLAALFTVSMAAGRHIVYSGTTSAGLAANYMTPMTALDFAVAVISMPVCVLMLLALAGAVDDPGMRLLASFRSATPRDISVRAMAAVATALFVAWLPYILTYAPGNVLPDSLTSHPRGSVAYMLVVRAFVYLGKALGDTNIGVFAYTLTQSLLMATVLAFGVILLRRRGAPAAWCVATVAYFAFVPVFPIYALNVQKDTAFSLFLVLLTLFLYEVARSEGGLLRSGRGIAAFAIAGTGAILFRSNGIYVVVATVLALLVFYRSGHRRFYSAAAAMLAVVLLIQGPVYGVVGFKRPPFVEAVGIPLQQMAYVVTTRGEIDASERRFLDQLLPYALWPSAYSPALVDSIKWNARFDEAFLDANKMRFAATWSSIGAKNPVAYAKAYCLQTFGFWKIGAHDAYGYADTRVTKNRRGIRAVDLFAAITGFSIKPALDATRGPDGRSGYVSVGFLLWIMLLAAVLVLLRRRTAHVLPMIPCVALWLSVMVATPVAFSLRYVFALALCLPGFLLAPFSGASQRGPAAETEQEQDPWEDERHGARPCTGCPP
jgi:hypothetical protein